MGNHVVSAFEKPDIELDVFKLKFFLSCQKMCQLGLDPVDSDGLRLQIYDILFGNFHARHELGYVAIV
jgi:hypothetical protein